MRVDRALAGKGHGMTPDPPFDEATTRPADPPGAATLDDWIEDQVGSGVSEVDPLQEGTDADARQAERRYASPGDRPGPIGAQEPSS